VEGFPISLSSLLFIPYFEVMPMNHSSSKLFCLVCFIAIGITSNAQNKKTVPPSRDTIKPIPVTLTPPPKTGPKPYREVITDKAISRKGLMWVHRVDDKWLLEIGDSLLNKDILLVNRIAKAPANSRVGFLGFAGDEINQNVIRFEKGPNNKIFLRTISYTVYAKDSAGPMYKSVMNSNVQPITAVFEIRAFSKDSTGSVIDITDVLTGDNEVFFFANSYKTSLRLGGLQNDKSYVIDIRPYPINMEIRTVKTYSRSSGPASGLTSGAPGGFATFELNSSMILLPPSPMRPRFFDDRVAYFTTEYTDFDVDPQGVKNVSIITRWRLEPKPGDIEKFNKGELVEPRKPIIFYIDPATPSKWVPYLIRGINAWQKSFEKAGFKNAIMGRPAPTREEDSTWSLEDARYSAIVYKPSEIANAQGPHVHDPRTGEILESHINWYHNIMSLLQRWYVVQAGASDPRSRKPRFDDELMGKLIQIAVSHEVGHTLGLPHNMGASYATPVEKLRDKEWLKANGHTSSIMDYARFNYVAQPEDSVGEEGLLPRIGDYDNWSIEWGYKAFPGKTPEEEKRLLNEWVKSKSSDQRLQFIHGDGYDPRAQSEDLGDNAVKAGTYGIKNLKRILPNLPAWVDEKGENYDRLQNFYEEVVTQYRRYMFHALANIGGNYADLKTTDQAGPVYKVVPKARQKEAMMFIKKNVFETPYWLLDKKILDLTSEPISDRISVMQDSFLASMLANSRLQRIIAAANREKDAYRLDEYLTDIKKGVWGELNNRQPIDNYRRNLQKSFVERFADIIDPPQAGGGGGLMIFFGPVTITDARKTDIVSISKAVLRSLKQEISVALPGYTDNMSKYHLQDLQERIEKVFKKD
jgi:hypothetical protein